MQNNQKPQITPDLLVNAKILECSCGGRIFEQKLVVKQVSAIMSPTANPLDVPIQVLVCSNCGKISPMSDPENILPDDLKSEKK